MAHEMQHRNPTTKLEELLRKYAWADSGQVLDLVLENWPLLQEAGLLEEAFVEAWGTQKWGCPNWTIAFCQGVFAMMDRAALLKAGDPLPPGDSFIVYRGVAGIGSKRRVRGYSWSADEGIAKGFAELRADRFGLPDPAVYSAVIQKEDVLTFIDGSNRSESEFLLLPHKLSNLRRVWRKSIPEHVTELSLSLQPLHGDV
jgi:hypothetical protein